MWIDREAESLITRMAASFPAILVTGARQVGKTSILRHLFPQAAYLTLDYPGHAEAARTEPEALLSGFEPPVIIDEIQYAPGLLRHVKARIDADRRPGRYLLTGSQVFPLMQGVSESLAGRCGVLDLHTLSARELKAAGRSLDEKELLFVGGYPELHVGAEPQMWFPSYVATYLERDVRNVLRVLDLQDFHRFLRAVALRTAQVLNFSDLARDTGIAPNTARKWVSLLEASGVVALAEPYFGNRTKRLIKSPKLMPLDTGLASFLAGFSSASALGASAFVGPLWEAHVFGQMIRWFSSKGKSPSVHYWRTTGGQEVDLVVELSGGKSIGIECKWTENPTLKDCAGLAAFREAEGRMAKATYLVCRPGATYRLESHTLVTDVPGLLKRLDQLD